MALLKGLGFLFLLPVTLVLGVLNVSVEDDGGILRSLVNMIFWGCVCVLLAAVYMVG